MPSTMIALGDFRFESNTNPYDSFSRQLEYRWQQQDVLLTDPKQQYLGPSQQTVTFTGTIHPLFRGGLGQIDAMRAEAEKGTPLRMVDGLGNVWGNWVITSISETRTAMFPDGVPRSIEFTLSIKYYG